ncbi:MAG TPA: protein kinase [Candidatus Omnitrophota bacterium]|nr:protein kinase [Candidatus Omnitrophota bacterium]
MEKQIGKYKILREIGKGGMGIVYKGLDPATQKEVAIKVLPPSLVDRSMVERFNREAAAMVRLKHPNIVEAYEFGSAQGQHFFAMEYVEGENLKTLIKNKGALAIDEALRVTVQVARALGFAHAEEGMSHRDIKPDNIIVKDDGGVKVMDFGLVQIPNVTRVTMQGAAVGTAEYMSPEQVSDSDIDTRTDLYSLGVTLFEMLIGRPPFQGESIQAVLLKHKNEPIPSLRSLRADVPEALERIVHKAMAKNVAERYQKAEEIVEDIKKFKGPDFVERAAVQASASKGPKASVKDDFISTRPQKKKSKKFFVFVLLLIVVTVAYVSKGKIMSFLNRSESLTYIDEENSGPGEMADGSQGDVLHEAEVHFQKLAKADEHHGQGLQYSRNGRMDEAAGEFKEAIALRPDYAPYYRDLALAYEALNQENLALEAWQDLLRYQTSGPMADEAHEHVKTIRGW